MEQLDDDNYQLGYTQDELEIQQAEYAIEEVVEELDEELKNYLLAQAGKE